ncbi:MAG: 3'-5' exonuclease [Deltaproteobacteria bacterium]|nr:3'-5' exonuclease [Deltaproteobacteria bacterium]
MPKRRERSSDGPPPGPPWDQTIHEALLAFVDVEATGLDPANDHIVEICIELVRGGQTMERLDTLVNPVARAGGAEHVHGLSAQMLSSAPRFSELADQVQRMLADAVFVAHASGWDVMYVEAEMARAGRPCTIAHHLDTLTLARRAFGMRSNRLGALASALGIEHARAHRASGDVAVMRGVFGRILAQLQPSTPRDLWHVRVGERQARPEVLAACEAAIGQGPVLLHYRPSGRAAEQFAFVVTGVRTELDPPRVIGYLVPGRGHRDLRSDRILAIEPSGDSSQGLAPGNT